MKPEIELAIEKEKVTTRDNIIKEMDVKLEQANSKNKALVEWAEEISEQGELRAGDLNALDELLGKGE